MKKNMFFLCICMLISMSAFSQIFKPVTWSYAAKKTSATEATVYIKAIIDKGWHIYSQYVGDGGPVKTTFTFPANKNYSIVGKTIEPKPIKKFESTFKMDVSYFENSVVFQQKIKFKGKTPVVSGRVEFMVCDDQQCLPPEEVTFSIPVK